MLKGISTSDWHLDGGLTRFFPNTATQKQLHEIEKICRYALEHDIKNIFIPGDLTDKARISEDTFIRLVALFLKFPTLTFYYLLGNHDFVHVGRTCIDVLKVFIDNSALANVKIFEAPKVVTLGGVDVGFVPFPATEAPKNKRPMLLFAHVEEAGAVGDYGVALKSATMGIKRSKRDFVITGHLHTYQHIKEKRIIFNGSPYQKTFGESPVKGFIEFSAKYNAEGNLMVRHQFVDNRCEFKLIDRRIENTSDWDELEVGEHVFYKLHLGEGIVVPKNITKDFPNIVSMNGVSYKGREFTETIEKKDTSLLPRYTPLTGLVDFLHGFELDKAEIKMAVKMVKEAIEHLKAEGKIII